MKKIISILCVVVGALSFSSLLGQVVKEPNFQSPNAASLGKFGDTPVSYHTGVPEISIPIFVVEEGNLSVPITLNYHSNGVKVEDVASFVGLGWNLVAGGSISRTIVGGPDEGKSLTYLISSDCGLKGWYKDYGMPSCLNLNSTDCPNVGYVSGPVEPGSGRGAGLNYTCYNIYMAAANGNIDTEPDIYSYNAPGLSGKFLFDANRKAHMIPEEDIYVKPEESPVLFNTWKIIGNDGTKYFFGGSNATETTYSTAGRAMSPTPDNRTATTWYITRMESANGEHWIDFEYEAEQSSYCSKATQTYIRHTNGQTGEYWLANGITITSTDGKRLSRITTSSGHTSVDFIESVTARQDLTGYADGSSTNTSSKSLSSIKINYGPNSKVFTLNTDYFQYTGSSDYGVTPVYAPESKRLKLVSVQESSFDNSIVLPAYQFLYEDSLQLPRRGSFSQDHWGYYNGMPNTALLPPFVDPINGQQRPGADRTSVASFMKLGILKQITYPSGGYTAFTYEPHKETPASTTLIGGLRVTSISDNDGHGNTVTRNFSYPQGFLYSGPLTYVQYPAQNPNTAPGVSWNIYDFGVLYTSAPNPPMQTSQGYHIGYSMVEVSSPGNGKSVYKYYNTYPIMPGMTAYPRVPTVAVVGTGQLFSEEHFNESGTIIKSTTYTYASTGGTVTIPAKKVLAVNPQNPTASPQYPYPMWNDYVTSTYRNRLLQKVEYADGLTTTTTFTYDAAHNSPKSSEFTSSNGAQAKTETTYPGDAGSGAPASMYNPADVNFKNMVTTPVEEKTLVNTVLKSKTTNQFTQTGSKIFLTSTKNYPTGTTAFIEDQYQYDGNSNLVSIIKSTGLNKAILWGYNNRYPIASVENAAYSSTPYLKFASFGTSVTTNTATCTNLVGTLVINEAQTVTFSSVVQLAGAAGIWLKLTLKNAGSTVVFGPRQYTAAGTYPESVSLSPGTYTFCYESGNFPSPFVGTASINFTVTYSEGLRSNLFHTSFEENGTSISSAHSGSKVWTGVYPLIMPHVIGTYELTYWQKPTNGSAGWTLVSTPLTISSTTAADLNIGQANYYIDDVRLHPPGAMMTTYTYTPAVGITSSSDPNHTMSFYEYDELGRLKIIKGDKQNIVKTYQYHYKGQN